MIALRVPHYCAMQFACFRIILGVYLTIHFVQLISFAPDIWSDQGMMADATLNFSYGAFPNILYVMDTPGQITAFIVFLALCSVALTVGFYRRTAALLLWFGWACLFHRNNLIGNPGLPMIGWLLLALVLIPLGEPLCVGKRSVKEEWYMPAPLYWGAWAIVGAAYTISGLDKCLAPSWRDGSAMLHLLENPLARDWFVREWLLALPKMAIHLMTWAALTLEVLFGVLCIFRRTRLLAWCCIMCMHIGILMVVNFADLTCGVIMIHLFTFDPDWFKSPLKQDAPNIVLFDGVCGMCNSWVTLLLGMDLEGRLKFASLQDDFARKMVPDASAELSTIVYLEGDTVYTKSTAILRILRQIGGPWALASAFVIIPVKLRDAVYDWIAAHRYKWFGKHETCRIPTPEQASRFISH